MPILGYHLIIISFTKPQFSGNIAPIHMTANSQQYNSCFSLFIFLFITVANSVWINEAVASGPASENIGVDAVAAALLQPYVFPFELASVVLLAILVGAVVIAKEDTPDA